MARHWRVRRCDVDCAGVDIADLQVSAVNGDLVADGSFGAQAWGFK